MSATGGLRRIDKGADPRPLFLGQHPRRNRSTVAQIDGAPRLVIGRWCGGANAGGHGTGRQLQTGTKKAAKPTNVTTPQEGDMERSGGEDRLTRGMATSARIGGTSTEGKKEPVRGSSAAVIWRLDEPPRTISIREIEGGAASFGISAGEEGMENASEAAAMTRSETTAVVRVDMATTGSGKRRPV